MKNGETSFISYAQNFEDVMLWRALKYIDRGFYVDVGAYHPVIDSVTKAFYNRGWSGINIEPVLSSYELFVKQRERDVNLQVAASDHDGQEKMYEIEGSGLSTLNEPIAQDHIDDGWDVSHRVIKTMKLDSIFQAHVEGPIHFLKIDVEGHEKSVLEGIDLSSWRPWLILIEAVDPKTKHKSSQELSNYIEKFDYHFVYFDGLNRFFISDEHDEFDEHFSTPPNVFDNFASYDYQKAKEKISLQNERINKIEREAHVHLEKLVETQDQLIGIQNQMVKNQKSHYKELRAKENKLHAFDSEIRLKDEEIKKYKEILEKKDNQIQDLQGRIHNERKMVENKEAEIKSLQEKISSKNERIRFLDKSIEKYNERLEALKRELSLQIKNLEQADDEIVEISESARFYISKYHQLLQSWSWKLSLPIRIVGRVIRVFKEGALTSTVKNGFFKLVVKIRNIRVFRILFDRFRKNNMDLWNEVKRNLKPDLVEKSTHKNSNLPGRSEFQGEDTSYYYQLIKHELESNQG